MEAFGDNFGLKQKYTFYRVAAKLQGHHVASPEVWICAQMLMLIENGRVTGTERSEAEEALKELGWELYKNIENKLILRPYVT